jgi:hypothetical protein
MADSLKAYMLVISYNEKSLHVNQLQEFISHNRNINHWWNYLPMVYVFTSSKKFDDLRDMFSSFFSDRVDFILSRFSPEETDGHLDNGAWQKFIADIEENITEEAK